MDEQRRLRDVFGAFPTGVAVVTATGPQGPAGLTTNAVTSLSLDPLLLLVCFDGGSRTLEAVRRSQRFAVNVLRAGQEDVARAFASKRPGPEKFEAVAHRLEDGAPVLVDALSWATCALRALHPGGDHVIGIGGVLAMDHDPGGDPLVFFRGGYTTLGAPA